MRKLITIAAIIVFLLSGSFVTDAKQAEFNIDKSLSFPIDISIFDNLKESLSELLNHIDENKINEAIQNLTQQLNQTNDFLTDNKNPNSDSEINEPIDIAPPREQLFSIANIELGDTKADVEKRYGQPDRSSYNEYGTEWHAYHDNYSNFFMVFYNENDQVAGMYTNQSLISSQNGIEIGTVKEKVLEKLGKPLDGMRKGLIMYQLPKDRDYDIFQMNNCYITVFYDKHENNTVTAMQVVSEDTENLKNEMYADSSEVLKEGFEYQLFDLTNASRVEHGLNPLTWDEHVRKTAREHSDDMAQNAYFSHTNLAGQSPFDRMKEDEIQFLVAGENLAYGQFSSIFAHEGLMNSIGHRENILQTEFEFLGVGVAFNTDSQPYFTENFYSN